MAMIVRSCAINTHRGCCISQRRAEERIHQESHRIQSFFPAILTRPGREDLGPRSPYREYSLPRNTPTVHACHHPATPALLPDYLPKQLPNHDGSTLMDMPCETNSVVSNESIEASEIQHFSSITIHESRIASRKVNGTKEQEKDK